MSEQTSLYERLKEVARQQGSHGVITYGEIAPMLGLNMENPADRNEIGRILGAISEREHNDKHPMLSVVVVHADTRYPGKGFFTLARELGLYHGDDELVFFVKELKKVQEYWRLH